ncbi:retrovirus-related Pol polyprotein from transposon TNT 1-94 [Trichonephila clavipes]|nr:retrovirus-related Pol polyprotein from transposon TNT 1-94 [Trichonephila clavipes]
MKQDLEKVENAYLSSFTSKKSKTLPGATAAAHGDPKGKNDYQKKGDLKPITNMKMSLATEDKSCPVEGIDTLRFLVKYKGSFHEITLSDVLFNPKLRRNLLSGSRLESKGAHFVGTKDGIKTLLKSSEVPHKFWGEALLCFTYAWNRICHKDSNKTPFEKYSGRKPSVLHLIPFGCLAYAGVPKQIRKKIDMRAKMGIMMAYAQRTKGYRIWLIDENKLVWTINGFSDLSEQQEALMVEVTIPNCYKQAIRSRDASKRHDAMDKEINVMMERNVWDSVDHPDNIKILENRWVYTIKYDENNKIVRYKARLVARGNTQLRGESFDEVFSPVINFTIVRLFFTICVCLWKWTHIQVDITNAYLYANLDTVIYMKQPTGYEIDNNKVYDMIKFGKEMENVNFVLQLLQKNFDLKIMGKTKKLLGIEFEELGNSLLIHQRSYIRKLCEIYEKYKYPVSSLPIAKGQVLSKLDSPKTSKEILTVPYRNLIGSLSFIAIRTRPDIMYAVNVLSQFQANPIIKHWNCLLRLLGYLKYTQKYKLELSKVKSLKLRCYSDSDFATNRDDRVSMGGFITFIDETQFHGELSSKIR